MRSALLGLLAIIIMLSASLTGMIYCWQEGLSNIFYFFGSMVSLVVFMGTIGFSVAYGAKLGFQKIDTYIRDLIDHAVQLASETTKDTVESLPQTFVDGIEQSVEYVGDKVLERAKRAATPWRYNPIPSSKNNAKKTADDVRKSHPQSSREGPQPSSEHVEDRTFVKSDPVSAPTLEDNTKHTLSDSEEKDTVKHDAPYTNTRRRRTSRSYSSSHASRRSLLGDAIGTIGDGLVKKSRDSARKRKIRQHRSA